MFVIKLAFWHLMNDDYFGYSPKKETNAHVVLICDCWMVKLRVENQSLSLYDQQIRSEERIRTKLFLFDLIELNSNKETRTSDIHYDIINLIKLAGY